MISMKPLLLAAVLVATGVFGSLILLKAKVSVAPGDVSQRVYLGAPPTSAPSLSTAEAGVRAGGFKRHLLEKVLATFAQSEGDASVLASRYFDSLFAAAKSGDTRAARLLHAGIGNCTNRPSQLEYAKLRPALPKQGRLSQKNMDETLKRCAGFTDSQLALDWDIVRDAADDGDDEMRVAYYNMSAEADKSLTSRLNNRVLEHYTRALPYLRDAAANGYADAYLSMGDVYAKGILQSADLTLAYAYKLAWLERLRAESAYPNEVSQFSVGLEREFADLSNAQRLQASAYAQAILRGEVL